MMSIVAECLICGKPLGRRATKVCYEHRGALSEKWTPEAIVEAMRNWAEVHGHAPIREDGHTDRTLPTVHTVQRKIGTWNDAIELAGLEIHQHQRPIKWTPERIIEALQTWGQTHGQAPTAPECLNANGLPTQATVVRAFGDWDSGIRAAGLSPRRLVAAPVGTCEVCGTPLSKGSRRDVTRFCNKHRFLPITKWDERSIIEALQTWAEQHSGDAPPCWASRGNPSLPSDGTMKRVFGSRNAAIYAAGLEPRRSGERRDMATKSQNTRREKGRSANRRMVTGIPHVGPGAPKPWPDIKPEWRGN